MSCEFSYVVAETFTVKLRVQYIKEETQTVGEKGMEARATRLITERASRRIGEMAFKIALTRPRKVRAV
jgi:isocitrate/isopropylmalate dehydrogenase